MKAKYLVAGVLLVVAVALVLWFINAGSTFKVANRSSVPVAAMVIRYERGEARFKSIPAGSEDKRAVGKIGEGATFDVRFEQGGEGLGATLNVYFGDLDPNPEIIFEVRDGRHVRVLNGHRILGETVAESVTGNSNPQR